MTEIPISPNIWKLARIVLTQKQLVVLELRERHGYSWNQLAIYTNTGKATVREHHRAATKNLTDAIEAAGGDIDLALQYATEDDAVAEPAYDISGIRQPRPTSEETPEEKTELDRLWKESA